MSVPELILAWHVRNRIVPLPRTANTEHLAANLSVFRLDIPASVLDEIDALNRNEPLLPNVCPEDFSLLAPKTSEY